MSGRSCSRRDCNLEGFLRPEAAETVASALEPEFSADAFRHARCHNIFFKISVPGLEPDQPALIEFETVNHTLCADQLAATAIASLNHWPPMPRFLADVMSKSALYPMDDPLAGVNAMAYGDGESLNWHFDRLNSPSRFCFRRRWRAVSLSIGRSASTGRPEQCGDCATGEQARTGMWSGWTWHRER